MVDASAFGEAGRSLSQDDKHVRAAKAAGWEYEDKISTGGGARWKHPNTRTQYDNAVQLCRDENIDVG